MDDQTLTRCILNEKQQSIFDKTTTEKINVIITDAGGTGKSHVAMAILNYFDRLYNTSEYRTIITGFQYHHITQKLNLYIFPS